MKWEVASPFFYHKKKAQALMELAVFGSIILMLLGMLINYGLRYNYQQQSMQQTFRKALVSANESNLNGTPVSVTHVVIKDVHVPSPSDPFAMGTVQQMLSSATISRTYRYDATPEVIEELPELRIEINGRKYPFKLAGLRNEWVNVTNTSFDLIEKRYLLIYGVGNVDVIGEVCLNWTTVEDQDPEYRSDPICTEMAKQLRIVDSCDGEIMDYESSYKRCLQLVNNTICADICNKDPWRSPSTDCNAICNANITIPWYCQGAVQIGSNYSFPALNNIFAMSSPSDKPRKMGLQDNYTQDIYKDNVLRKQETFAGVTTTDNFDWQVDTSRLVVYRPLNTTSTATRGDVGSVSQNKTTTWDRNW
jgi:hypothetical protein